MSSRSVSSKANKPSQPERDEWDVETYRLPRWDAHGNLIEEPRHSPSASPEDVEDIEVTLPTAEEVRQIHEDAYNEGFESGYEQGLRQGQQEGQKQGHQEGYASGEQAGREAGEKAGVEIAQSREEARIEEHLQPLAGVLSELRNIIPTQETELKDGLVALAVRIARNVIDAELALKPEHIGDLVHAAVQALPNADERLTIELNPEDLALVERVADGHWQLQPNADLSRGGCVVRTRYSHIDYTLEHRYRQQVSNLLAHIGLSERLTEFEQPWPLPEANTPEDHSDVPAEPAIETDQDDAPSGDVAGDTDADASEVEASEDDVSEVDASEVDASDAEQPELEGRDTDTVSGEPVEAEPSERSSKAPDTSAAEASATEAPDGPDR